MSAARIISVAMSCVSAPRISIWRPLKGCAPWRRSSDLGDVWLATQPSGEIDALALDIPLQATEKTRFRGDVERSGTKQWKLLPGAENFSGKLEGSVENGRLTVEMHDAKMPYETVFRAPLEIEKGNAVLNWLRNDKGFQLDGRHIDVKAKAVHARGDFRYLKA